MNGLIERAGPYGTAGRRDELMARHPAREQSWTWGRGWHVGMPIGDDLLGNGNVRIGRGKPACAI